MRGADRAEDEKRGDRSQRDPNLWGQVAQQHALLLEDAADPPSGGGEERKYLWWHGVPFRSRVCDDWQGDCGAKQAIHRASTKTSQRSQDNLWTAGRF